MLEGVEVKGWLIEMAVCGGTVQMQSVGVAAVCESSDDAEQQSRSDVVHDEPREASAEETGGQAT